MPFEQGVADRLDPLLAGKPGAVETRMFGGFGYLINGNMSVGIYKNFLIVRLGEENFNQLCTEYEELRPMDITGKPMKGWGMIDAYACDDGCFKHLVESCESFVRTLPEKQKKKKE